MYVVKHSLCYFAMKFERVREATVPEKRVACLGTSPKTF